MISRRVSRQFCLLGRDFRRMRVTEVISQHGEQSRPYRFESSPTVEAECSAPPFQMPVFPCSHDDDGRMIAFKRWPQEA